jgi:hydroxymethylpyrimidine/phosphomethylpyrimidine kinase
MPPIVLTFAASDPTGGAGLQADLLTLAALGCHPLSVVTGLTVQDTRGVESLEAVASALVRARRAAARGKPVAAFKAGVLASPNVRAVAAIVARTSRCPWCSIRCWPRDAATRWRAMRCAPRSWSC